MKVERIQVEGIPKPPAHYTPAVRAGDLVFAAGQIASDYKTGVAPEARVDPTFPYYGSDIQRQTRYIPENLQKTFQAAGTALDRVVKAQVFLTDLHLFPGFDEVWREFFPTPPPRTTVGTTGLLVPGLSEGYKLIRQDEGRHVGFGLRMLRHYARRDPRYAARIREIMEGVPADDPRALRPDDGGERPDVRAARGGARRGAPDDAVQPRPPGHLRQRMTGRSHWRDTSRGIPVRPPLRRDTL